MRKKCEDGGWRREENKWIENDGKEREFNGGIWMDKKRNNVREERKRNDVRLNYI